MASDEWDKHLASLLREHDLTVTWVNYPAGLAHRGRRWVRLPRPLTPLRYLVALHEIGHCVAPRAWWGRFVEREAAAWGWALAQAHHNLTARDARAIIRRLDHYLEYGPAHYRAKYPAPSSPFWSTYYRLAVLAGVPSQKPSA